MLLALGILMLLFEVIKGARPGAKYFTDHLLSLIVFGGAAAEFLLLPQFGTSTYFLLTALALVDFLSGIALRTRRPRVASVATCIRKVIICRNGGGRAPAISGAAGAALRSRAGAFESVGRTQGRTQGRTHRLNPGPNPRPNRRRRRPLNRSSRILMGRPKSRPKNPKNLPKNLPRFIPRILPGIVLRTVAGNSVARHPARQRRASVVGQPAALIDAFRRSAASERLRTDLPFHFDRRGIDRPIDRLPARPT